MAAETPELGIVQRGTVAVELDAKASRWLARQLRERAGAPLVPVSALDRALQQVGASFTGLSSASPDPGALLRSARRRLFPPARVKALHRWLRGFTGEDSDPEEAAAADAILDVLRRVDPLGAAGATHPVLKEVLGASFEAATGVDVLRGVLRHLEESAWPADAQERLAPHERAIRWLSVRVAPVDLLGALRAEHLRVTGRRRAGGAAEAARQMVLLDASARPLAGTARIHRAGREATADALDAWLTGSRGVADAVALARALRDRLRGAPGDDDAVDALLRASALELLERCSAAELTRIEATLVAPSHDAGPLLEYGDYLARAWRSDEAVRAYHFAREIAPPGERPRLDDRIAGREVRLSGALPRRRREPPEQLPLLF